MNTLLLQKISLCAALAIALQNAHAKTHTNYIGPDNGLYSNPANWSNGVPINNTFDAINNTDFIIRLDIDPTIKSLTLQNISAGCSAPITTSPSPATPTWAPAIASTSSRNHFSM